MTGEITLSGLVFPVGGIKGKVLAARRGGMKRVVLPEKNRPDLKDVPDEALRDIEVLFVDRIDDLLSKTLEPEGKVQAGDLSSKSEPVPAAQEVGIDGGARA